MANLASSPGLLNMLPGFRQLSQVRHLKGQKMEDIFGSAGDSIRSMARGKPMMLPQGGLPGLPSGTTMPAFPGMPGAMPQRLPDGRVAIPANAIPPGMTPEEYVAMLQGQQHSAPGVRQLSNKDKQKAKNKRKAEKKARKKSRRR
jgi:hypothetical protein